MSEPKKLIDIEEYKLKSGYSLRNGTINPIPLDNGFILSTNPEVAKMFEIYHLWDTAKEDGNTKFLIPVHGSKKSVQNYLDSMYKVHKIIFIVNKDVVQAYERTVSPMWTGLGYKEFGVANHTQFLTNTHADNW